MSSTENVKLSSDQPIDDLAAHLMQTVARKGRGFVFGMAEKPGSGAPGEALRRQIEVVESLPPHDEWEPPASYRSHAIEDTASFINYAKRYGDKTKSLIFYSETGCSITLDEQVSRGSREQARYQFVEAADWQEWRDLFGKPVNHRQLLNFLIQHERNLVEPQILQAMQTVRLNSQVNYDSDVVDDGGSVGFFVKTSSGDELKKFPKSFNIILPILDQDTGNTADWTSAEVKLRVQLPVEDVKNGATFILVCPMVRQIKRNRVDKEGEEIALALQDWTVIHGLPEYLPRDLPSTED